MIMDATPQPEIDWAAGAELVGASPLQVKFVQGLCAGLNQTQACKQAGYRGQGAALRGAASRLAKGNRVRALLSWAQAGGAGPSDVEGDPAELKKILWRHARGADKTHSIRATEVLHKLATQERQDASRMDDFGDGTAVFRRIIAAAGPAGALAGVATYFQTHQTLCGIPLAKEVLPLVAQHYPEAWAEMMGGAASRARAPQT
jgi:hypothetical protein